MKAIIEALIDFKKYSSSKNIKLKNFYERIVLDIYEFMHQLEKIEIKRHENGTLTYIDRIEVIFLFSFMWLVCV